MYLRCFEGSLHLSLSAMGSLEQVTVRLRECTKCTAPPPLEYTYSSLVANTVYPPLSGPLISDFSH